MFIWKTLYTLYIQLSEMDAVEQNRLPQTFETGAMRYLLRKSVFFAEKWVCTYFVNMQNVMLVPCQGD